MKGRTLLGMEAGLEDSGVGGAGCGCCLGYLDEIWGELGRGREGEWGCLVGIVFARIFFFGE